MENNPGDQPKRGPFAWFKGKGKGKEKETQPESGSSRQPHPASSSYPVATGSHPPSTHYQQQPSTHYQQQPSTSYQQQPPIYDQEQPPPYSQQHRQTYNQQYYPSYPSEPAVNPASRKGTPRSSSASFRSYETTETTASGRRVPARIPAHKPRPVFFRFAENHVPIPNDDAELPPGTVKWHPIETDSVYPPVPDPPPDCVDGDPYRGEPFFGGAEHFKAHRITRNVKDKGQKSGKTSNRDDSWYYGWDSFGPWAYQENGGWYHREVYEARDENGNPLPMIWLQYPERFYPKDTSG
ncbi:hypothetical protein QBC40DRAFT_258531 [Triangularia verruculosa]|uniref:Uncharacterized protein n=1 Tax=Triangularia verruculosa TaxID=2587418 RepID=A0AAN6XAB8_9PEZI|nr:hypothetical protein QBC40DRAFT_258531 [Triangularia verruculosa]